MAERLTKGRQGEKVMFLYDSERYRKDVQEAVFQVKDIEKLKGSSVLVTGAAGLIGSFVVDMLLTADQLLGMGIKVFAVGRSKERLLSRFQGWDTEDLVFVQQDVTEPLQLDHKVDHIIHAASNAYPEAFSQDPVGTMMSNITGTLRLLEYGREHGARRFLFLSSGEVYGQGDVSIEAYEEGYSGYVDILSPRSCYPSSKRAAETLCCSFWKQYGLETVIARPCHTYGPNTTGKDNRATAQFMENVGKGQDIVLKSAGSQMRSYAYVADCASGLLTVLLKGHPGEAYNLAYEKSRITIAGFAQITARLSGRQVVFEDPDKKALEERSPVPRQVLDSRRLEALGWQGRYTPERGIQHTLEILKGKAGDRS